MDASTVQIPGLKSLGAGKALAAIGVVSLAAVGFLFWLIYFRSAGGHSSAIIGALPALNASLNALSAVLLISGYIAVRRRNYVRHIAFMLAAVASSALFLVSYIVYHSFHGDTKFTAPGIVRPIYFLILISHIVLSVIVVPMILTSLWLSLSGRMAAHRRVSRWTLPIWLYVSVTGVLIFVILKLFNGPAAV
ncbi:MAG: putative rane protein [Phycisphaerales bacterium]|jgi:putative membrane protein|nr:putative rane protein [Phycisphaerales bacterium]